MAQLSDDCFAGAGELMPLDEALKLIRARLEVAVAPETVPLADACGRVLASDLTAAMAVPPHDNSAVDGYAFRFADLAAGEETRLAVIGRAAAGHPFEEALPARAAVRIFTGAPMPEGADTVVMQEDVDVDGDVVIVPHGLKAGANRRKAGEDIAPGDGLLKTGRRLTPQDVGLAASVGAARLSVYRRLRVAVVSTGDELREPGSELPEGAIYDANRFMLMGLLGKLGAEARDMGILRDDRETVRTALENAAKDHDLVLSSGGVSVGEEDHVGAALNDLGRLHFWRLAIKPGRPIALGQIGQVPFVGLPGNPVAAILTFLRLVRPIIEILSGAQPTQPRFYPVTAGFAHTKKTGRREWVRVRIETDDDGRLVAHKFPHQGAGVLSSVTRSDGIVELPENATGVEPGMRLDFLPFSELGA